MILVHNIPRFTVASQRPVQERAVLRHLIPRQARAVTYRADSKGNEGKAEKSHFLAPPGPSFLNAKLANLDLMWLNKLCGSWQPCMNWEKLHDFSVVVSLLENV